MNYGVQWFILYSLLQAQSLVSQFKTAGQLLNPVSLLKFDAVEIRSSKEGKWSHGAGQGSGERFEFLIPLLYYFLRWRLDFSSVLTGLSKILK